MSHHLDSPNSRRDPRLNVTDLYVFDGERGTVLAMAVNTSLAGDLRTAGFHPEARYEFKIHEHGASRESVTYRFVFGGAEAGGAQQVSVFRLVGTDAGDDGAAGGLLAHGTTGRALEADGIRAWAGEAADPFYLDLDQLSHIIKGLQSGAPIQFDDWVPAKAASSFEGSSIYAIVLEIPGSDAELPAGRRIGVWAATKLATDSGGWRQVNRAAIPMLWPLFRAIGDSDDDADYQRDAAAHPSDDPANDGQRMTEFITAAARISGRRNPEAHAAAVVQRLLPDVLPYQVGTPASFSFAKFNGRSFADNAPEVVYSLVTNTGFPTGLDATVAARTRSDAFPYVIPVLQH